LFHHVRHHDAFSITGEAAWSLVFGSHKFGALGIAATV
jgi:hypothetical protein